MTAVLRRELSQCAGAPKRLQFVLLKPIGKGKVGYPPSSTLTNVRYSKFPWRINLQDVELGTNLDISKRYRDVWFGKCRGIYMALDNDVKAKLLNDDGLPTALRDRVFDECDSLRTEAESATRFDDIAASNRLSSSIGLTPESDEVLGHIKAINGFAAYLTSRLNDLELVPRFHEDDVKEIFRAATFPTSTQNKRDADLWITEEVLDRLPTYTLSGRPSWIFRDASGRDARSLLAGHDRHMLPCRLGLPEPDFWGTPAIYKRGIEFVGFAFAGTAVFNPRRPTALDGCYDSVKKIWITGGVTCPLPHGPQEMRDAGGLPEVVAEPVLLADAVRDVYVFRN